MASPTISRYFAFGWFATLVSRLQRDLSNSTVVRNVASIFAYSYLAVQSTLTGLSKISPNATVIKEYLLSNWSILSEALQTELRFTGHANAYEEVKQKVMGVKLDEKGWKELVSSLKIPAESKDKLKALTPLTYLGYADKLAI